MKTPVRAIDLNADVGEGFDDSALLPWVTSLNVACGGHAGGPASMRATLLAGAERGLAVGAHPSYPDREGFGRREMEMTPEELERSLAGQIGALRSLAVECGVVLAHAKPHGALYNRAARDLLVARAVARAVAGCDRGLVLVGPPGSCLLEAGRELGLAVAAEGFADRAYRSDGSLARRGTPGAVHDDPRVAAAQAVAIARGEPIATVDGPPLVLGVATLCIHSDSPGAPAIARATRWALETSGFTILPLVRP